LGRELALLFRLGGRPSLRAKARRRTSGSLGRMDDDGRSAGFELGRCGSGLGVTLWCPCGPEAGGGAMLGDGGGMLRPRFSALASAAMRRITSCSAFW
jgi:hypothetical protein